MDPFAIASDYFFACDAELAVASALAGATPGVRTVDQAASASEPGTVVPVHFVGESRRAAEEHQTADEHWAGANDRRVTHSLTLGISGVLAEKLRSPARVVQSVARTDAAMLSTLKHETKTRFDHAS